MNDKAIDEVRKDRGVAQGELAGSEDAGVLIAGHVPGTTTLFPEEDEPEPLPTREPRALAAGVLAQLIRLQGIPHPVMAQGVPDE